MPNSFGFTIKSPQSPYIIFMLLILYIFHYICQNQGFSENNKEIRTFFYSCFDKIRRKECKRTFIIHVDCDQHHELCDKFPEACED